MLTFIHVGLEVTVQMCIQIFRSNSDSQTERPSIRGIYLPMLHPKPLLLESNRSNYRPPIPLVFNSETRAFLPLAAQEEEETTLFESLPWPPLLPLFAGQVSISRSLSCSLTLFYALARSLSLSVALFRSLSCSLSSPVLRSLCKYDCSQVVGAVCFGVTGNRCDERSAFFRCHSPLSTPRQWKATQRAKIL